MGSLTGEYCTTSVVSCHRTYHRVSCSCTTYSPLALTTVACCPCYDLDIDCGCSLWFTAGGSNEFGITNVSSTGNVSITVVPPRQASRSQSIHSSQETLSSVHNARVDTQAVDNQTPRSQRKISSANYLPPGVKGIIACAPSVIPPPQSNAAC